jgi:hypothetical protein
VISFLTVEKGESFMKKTIFLFAVLFVSVGNIFAQNVPGVPNGAVAKDSRDEYDNGIRMRSMELERIKRENYRSAMAEKAAEHRRLNYNQIKKDFELIQNLQNQIIKTYVTGKQINYQRISELASKLNECAVRLDKNLSLYVEETEKKSKKNNSEPGDVKDTIVILDKSLGKFVTSPIFRNLNVVETKDAEKAEFELKSVIRLSDLLARKAEKQK